MRQVGGIKEGRGAGRSAPTEDMTETAMTPERPRRAWTLLFLSVMLVWKPSCEVLCKKALLSWVGGRGVGVVKLCTLKSLSNVLEPR